MSRYAVILTALLSAALLTAAGLPFASAQNGRAGGRPGAAQAGHPSVPQAGHVNPGHAAHPVQPNIGWSWPRTVITVNPWYSYYGYGYRYPYYYGYGYPYSYYGYDYPRYGYGYGYAFPPPLTVPTESLYGIGPIQRMMGVDVPNNPPVRVARPIVEPPAAAAPQEVPAAVKQKAEDSQAALADRYLEMGDVQFAAGKYVTALERYRRATAIVPRDGDPQFRMAFAFLATEQYDLAAKAIRKGLKLDPQWPKSGFRLGDLYGGDERAKASHLEVLAQAAEDKPQKADLLFLIGVFLYSDGQRERAKPFFARAAQLEQVDRSPIDAFGE